MALGVDACNYAVPHDLFRQLASEDWAARQDEAFNVFALFIS